MKVIYDALLTTVMSLGSDVEIAPKKAYVSLRRKKQFACLKPATKNRFELDLIIKDQDASGVLEKIKQEDAMCTHRIKLERVDDISPETIAWIKKAYEKAN